MEAYPIHFPYVAIAVSIEELSGWAILILNTIARNKPSSEYHESGYRHAVGASVL